MTKPRRKKMGRPLEDVPLRKLVKSIRLDIAERLEKTEPQEALEARKSKRKQ